MTAMKHRFLIIAFLIFSGSFAGFAQDSMQFEELIVKAPGFNASKKLESIKSQVNSSNGLVFVAWYKQSEIFHFRIDRRLQPDNNLIYSIFADVDFTIIQDQEKARTIINELTQPKVDIVSPVLKNE